HDRDFRMAQLDADVVDAEAVERRHQMFNGFDRGRIQDEPGLKLLASAKVRYERGNLDAQVRAKKTNAVTSGSWLQAERHFLAGMQPDAGAGDESTKCSLHGSTRSVPSEKQVVCQPYW